MATEFIRPPKCEADTIGGKIGNLISNQYEKEYIERAQAMDARY